MAIHSGTLAANTIISGTIMADKIKFTSNVDPLNITGGLRVFPGTISIADPDGRAIRVEPTGAGKAIVTTDEGVTINEVMARALINAINNGVSYNKPRRELE